MQRQGPPPDAVSLTALLGACQRACQWECSLALLQLSGGAPDAAAFTACLLALAGASQAERSVVLLSRMRRAGVKASAADLSAVAEALNETGRWQLVLEVFASMSWRSGVEVDLASASAMSDLRLKAVLRAGGSRWQQALHALLRERPPSAKAVSLVLGSASGANNWQLPLELIGRLRSLRGEPDAALHSDATCALIRTQQWAQGLALLRVSPELGVEPNVQAFNSMASSCLSAGQWRRALSFLVAEMRPRDLRPSIVSLSAAMSAIGAAQEERLWPAVLQILRTSRQQSLEVDAVAANSALAAVGRSSWRLALLLLAGAAMRGLRSSTIGYSAMLTACERALQWPRALCLLLGMRRRRLHVDTFTCNTVISACGGAGKGEKSLQLLRQLGSEASLVSYNAGISGCEKRSLWPTAVGLPCCS
ncbi:unnamed protein product [Polarella glacialis]|uniref:Pentatricopeptide repeat-containing protein, chloroplastic n=1 Tax=Polarella glacialis TaxID=89957 RepID=A0A813DH96_POLGL|nr:unnamed protein product [Polarella glacialis]